MTLILLAITSLSIIEAILRRVKKLYPEEELIGEVGRWFSWIIYGLFVVTELVRRFLSYSPILQILPIGLGAIYFLLVLIYSYIKAG